MWVTRQHRWKKRPRLHCNCVSAWWEQAEGCGVCVVLSSSCNDTRPRRNQEKQEKETERERPRGKVKKQRHSVREWLTDQGKVICLILSFYVSSTFYVLKNLWSEFVICNPQEGNSESWKNFGRMCDLWHLTVDVRVSLLVERNLWLSSRTNGTVWYLWGLGGLWRSQKGELDS